MNAGSLWVQETYLNSSKGYQFGESDVYETFTDDAGELYRFCVKEFGRCTGRIGVDTEDGSRFPVGWVFEKRMPYEDDPSETYLREVWVTVHQAAPTTTTEYHYAETGRR